MSRVAGAKKGARTAKGAGIAGLFRRIASVRSWPKEGYSMLSYEACSSFDNQPSPAKQTVKLV